jgi:hypothetical protein
LGQQQLQLRHTVLGRCFLRLGVLGTAGQVAGVLAPDGEGGTEGLQWVHQVVGLKCLAALSATRNPCPPNARGALSHVDVR